MKTTLLIFEAVVLSTILCLHPQWAQAATLTITSTADSGIGSLREALANASDGDTIDATGVSGMILLTSGELVVSKSVNILGPGPNTLAVDGNATSRVFHITNGVTATIFGLTITNGHAFWGAGIYNEKSSVTVNNCTLRGNSASDGGGIFNDHATSTVSNSVISDNSVPGFGGGIINDVESGGSATLTVVNSTLGNNSAVQGGGIYNIVTTSGRATLLIANSILSSNYSFGNGGGGIYNWGVEGASIATLTIVNCSLNGNSAGSAAGGGIANIGSDGGSATLTVVKSTLNGNTEASYGGGIFNNGFAGGGNATLLIADSTLSGNSATSSGGGVCNIGEYSGSAQLQIINSTLSGNSAPQGASIFNNMLPDGLPSIASVEIGSTILEAGTSGETITNDSGTVTSLGYNLSSDDGGGYLTNATDQINTGPMLGPLQDNGGPTFTHALLRGSPAIDKGTNFTGAVTDQRGQPRTYDNPGLANAAGGEGTDIGAFEFIPPALAITPNYGNVILSWPAGESGYKVESTTLLGSSANWTTVPGTPIVIGNQHFLGDGPVTGSKFYRLRSP